MGHDGHQRAQLYEDSNVADTIRNSVAIHRNLGSDWVPPPQAAILPWKTVTNLKWPGSLGPLVGAARWDRAINLANIFIDDAVGSVFPRTGPLSDKLKFCFNMYPAVRNRA
jgi:hypothetical protein